ncbi:AAA ATPase [Microsporum canis]|uniref:Cell division control protein n=1 Tax=Arthroderma otae (strain ATCC MYA-4605 / CBS 113480) TaxID=554155 RepID=C5FYA3_ARTOC|nr:cell division control protein 18 [Microsporum canis CBS 113480]EEQ34501.1 cell division control protein 18 [Microsporum canis CBS 113480]
MASAVLGKRQRSALESTDTPSLRSPSKRLARASKKIYTDEEDPFISSTSQKRSSSRSTITRKRPSDANTPSRNVRTKRIDHDKTNKTTAGDDNDENVEPVEFSTPKAQRYTNAFLPVTPKHRVQIGGKPLTPRTPRTPSTPKTTRSVFTAAKQLFTRSVNPGQLVGRDDEAREMKSFIQRSVESGKGGCIYVSGPPGTGKTALVDEVSRELGKFPETIKLANVNCASLTNARDIYSNILEGLCESTSVFRKSESERLEAMFLPKKSSSPLYLVILDEIDHLLSGDIEILYKLFEWSLHKLSHLILVGIANALDLTDRLLPRLKAKNLKPHLLPFLPYTPTQITDVITTRLRSLLPAECQSAASQVPFLHPAAIQLCSRKVASQSGDLRKAFDIVYRTISLLERETQLKASVATTSPSKLPLLENKNLASSLPAPQPTEYTAATAPRATIAHVARVTSSTFGNGTIERLQDLNLQQKAALCALISFGKKQQTANVVYKTPSKSPRSTAPSSRELFETYSGLCRRDNILQPLTATEFRDVISSLETMGLVGEVDARSRGAGSPAASGLFSTPSRSGRGRPSVVKGMVRSDDSGLVCLVGEKEVQSQISGPGEGILKALLAADDY